MNGILFGHLLVIADHLNVKRKLIATDLSRNNARLFTEFVYKMDNHALIKTLKQAKQGQISKLQLKAESENELLEVMRDYMAVSFVSVTLVETSRNRRTILQSRIIYILMKELREIKQKYLFSQVQEGLWKCWSQSVIKFRSNEPYKVIHIAINYLKSRL
jgi:hypothetical protein